MKEKKERNDEIVSLYSNSPFPSIVELSSRFGISRQAVYAILKRRDTEINKNIRGKDIQEKRNEKIMELHNDGRNIAQIAKELKGEFKYISETTVSRILKGI